MLRPRDLTICPHGVRLACFARHADECQRRHTRSWASCRLAVLHMSDARSGLILELAWTRGWVYCAVALDVFARRVVGWSIADHLRCELVVDALKMARWRRKPSGRADRGATTP